MTTNKPTVPTKPYVLIEPQKSNYQQTIRLRHVTTPKEPTLQDARVNLSPHNRTDSYVPSFHQKEKPPARTQKFESEARATTWTADDSSLHTTLRHTATAIPTSIPNQQTMNREQTKIPTEQRTRITTKANAWQHIIQANNLSQLPHATTIFDAAKITRCVKHAISDSGATDHFLIKGMPAVNIKIATNPITITLPNGKVIQSTHTCNLDIPWLPAEMTEGHIVPGLAHASLISTRKFCDAGCKVVFDMHESCVYYQGKLVLTGDRNPTTQLWRLPINPTGKSTNAFSYLDLQTRANQTVHHGANALYTLPFKQNQLNSCIKLFSIHHYKHSSMKQTTNSLKAFCS